MHAQPHARTVVTHSRVRTWAGAHFVAVERLISSVAEIVVPHVVMSATAAAAGHLPFAVALEARESGLAVRVAIAVALAFATLLA